MKNKVLTGLKKYILPAVLSAVLLCGCGSTAGNGPENTQGEIQVISREDGSGTKTQFEECLGLTGVKSDLVGKSTAEVISAVKENKNAIGYAAGTAVQDEAVKVLAVDGIAPDNENIKKGKYPLSRDYSLVYNSDFNEAEEDFLRFIETAGQKLVEEYCIPVSKEQTFLSSKASGTITLCGSSSMEGVMTALVEQYNSINPKVQIDMTITDSGDGIQKAMQGDCDFGMASRSLKSYEAELLDSFVLGRDGIAVVVNEENVAENITTKQLKAVYSEEITDWGEIK